jgi:hypothetical protein
MEIEAKELDKESEDLELDLPKTSELFYMLSIAGRKRANLIGPCHLSIR